MSGKILLFMRDSGRGPGSDQRRGAIWVTGQKRLGNTVLMPLNCVVLQGLKSHAVTMFEVGKLNDESLDSFLTELGKASRANELVCV